MRIDQTTPEIAMRELEPDVRIDPEYVSDVYLVYREGWLDPVAMAHAMRHAVIAGRLALEAGRMEKRLHAVASSPK